MFFKEEMFNGDLSREKLKDSVPSPLLHLISLNVANSKNVAVNIGQLITFNTQKHKDKPAVPQNEPPPPVKIHPSVSGSSPPLHPK